MVCGGNEVTFYCKRVPIKGDYYKTKVRSLQIGEQIYNDRNFTRVDKIKKTKNNHHYGLTLEDDQGKRLFVCFNENEYVFIKNMASELHINTVKDFDVDEDFRMCYYYRSVANVEVGDILYGKGNKDLTIIDKKFRFGDDYELYTRSGFVFTSKGVLIMTKKSKRKHRINSKLYRSKKSIIRKIYYLTYGVFPCIPVGY